MSSTWTQKKPWRAEIKKWIISLLAPVDLWYKREKDHISVMRDYWMCAGAKWPRQSFSTERSRSDGAQITSKHRQHCWHLAFPIPGVGRNWVEVQMSAVIKMIRSFIFQTEWKNLSCFIWPQTESAQVSWQVFVSAPCKSQLRVIF